MTMELSNRPKARSITPQAQQILDIIREADTWVTRREIANEMDKNRLNPWDQALLRKLRDEGLIEVERRLRSDEITLEYIYRALDVADDDAYAQIAQQEN